MSQCLKRNVSPAKELHRFFLTSDSSGHHDRLEDLPIKDPQPRLRHRCNSITATASLAYFRAIKQSWSLEKKQSTTRGLVVFKLNFHFAFRIIFFSWSHATAYSNWPYPLALQNYREIRENVVTGLPHSWLSFYFAKKQTAEHSLLLLLLLLFFLILIFIIVITYIASWPRIDAVRWQLYSTASSPNALPAPMMPRILSPCDTSSSPSAQQHETCVRYHLVGFNVPLDTL